MDQEIDLDLLVVN